MQCSDSYWTVFKISFWRDFCDAEEERIFTEGDHQLDIMKVLSVGGALRQLSIFVWGRNPREERVNGVFWSVSHTTDIHVILSFTPNACQPVTVTPCWEDISAKHWLMQQRLQTNYRVGNSLLPSSFNIPATCKWLFYDALRERQSGEIWFSPLLT